MTQTITVPIIGDTAIEPDETYTVTLSSPTNATLGTSTAIGTITNDDYPAVSISAATNNSVAEGTTGVTTNATYTVTLSATPLSQVTVPYSVAGTGTNTATSGTDFTATSGTLTFAANATTLTQTITVPIIGDTAIDPDETYTVTLSSPTNATLGTSTAIGTITNDDAATINFSISGTSVQEGNSNTTSLPFVVTLSGLTCTNQSQTFTVDYATADGTAGHATTSPTNDYTAKNGTLTFVVQSANNNQCKVKDATNNGNTLKDSSGNNIYISSSNNSVYQTLKVNINGDTVPESDETLTVTLSNPTSSTGITAAVGTGTILNDDVTDVTMTMSASPTSVGMGGTVTYSMQALYTGAVSSPSGSIIITDPLPSGMTYVSSSGNNWSCTGTTTLVCTYNSTISSGSQSSTLTIQATAPNTIGTYDNIATVSTTNAIVESSTATANNTAHAVVTVLSAQVDMVLTKTATSSVVPSGAIVYTLRGTNNGNTSATGISIVDHFPAGVAYGSKSGTNWTCSSSGSVSTGLTVTCTYSTSVAAGAQTNLLTLNATAPSTTGSITNTATISTTSAESSTTNNSASASTTVSATAVSYTSDNPRVFDIIYTANMNGDIKMIGNSVLCKDNGSGVCTAPDSATPNNSTDTLFYTLASDSADTAIFNSSSYTLSLPSGVKNSDVLWAGLYWQGEYKGTVTSSWMDTAKNVKLKAPGDSAYRDLTAETTGNRFNWMVNGSSYMYYQGVRDITSIVQGSGAGTYQVANVQTSYGTAYSPGHFGGWAITIVYKDLNTTLKNMTVYDGYSAVDTSNPLSVNATGFLTPSSGTVESKFTIFATEGDISYTADKLTLSTSSGMDTPVYKPGNTSKNNPFNSSITDETGATISTREPSYPNMIGVDIHTYNVGTAGVNPFNILGAGQTSTNIKLSTGDDVFNPGAFAFSTQLYIPDVCYTEDVYYKNALVSSSNIPPQNDNVTYEVGITNKNNEVAKGVFIEKVFDKPREISYVVGSMSIDAVPKFDTPNDDTAEFSSDTNTSKFLLGVGAVAGTGGTIAKDFLTKFKYQAKIGDQNASENTYLVSYRNDQLGVTFNGLPIRKCQDFNNSFSVYVPVLGKFNTVRSGAVAFNGTDTDPVTATDPKNAHYTQIVNNSFNVDVISFASDNITPTAPTAVDLNLSIVELTNEGNCTSNNLSAVQTLHFSTSDKYKPATVTPLKASKNAAFHMVTPTANLCSSDNFAIRPYSYVIDANETRLVGGKAYDFTFRAGEMNATTTPSVSYNQTVYNGTDKNATTKLVTPVGCALATPTEYTNIALPFTDGLVTAQIIYPNIGDINMSVTDNAWTADSQDQTKDDCVVGSDSNTLVNGKFGCMIRGFKSFTFLPARFDGNVSGNSLSNYNGNTFTYLSSDQNMSARFNFNINALLDNGAIATNYTQKCFARDVNTTVTLRNHPTTDLIAVNGKTGALNRVMMFGNNTKAQKLSSTPPAAVFKTSEGNFTSGSSAIYVDINFDRNATIAENSFKVALTDLNVSFIDVNNTIGSDFNRADDMNTTFVYGRFIPRDIRVFGNTADAIANGWYEVYNTPTLAGMALSPSRNDAMWYINKLHNDTTDGDALVTQVSAGYLPFNTIYVNGVKTYNFDPPATIPFSAKAHINTESWLWYGQTALTYSDPIGANLNCLTHPCFNISIVPPIGSSGSTKTTTTNSSSNSSKVSKLTTVSSGLVYDYAPATR